MVEWSVGGRRGERIEKAHRLHSTPPTKSWIQRPWPPIIIKMGPGEGRLSMAVIKCTVITTIKGHHRWACDLWGAYTQDCKNINGFLPYKLKTPYLQGLPFPLWVPDLSLSCRRSHHPPPCFIISLVVEELLLVSFFCYFRFSCPVSSVHWGTLLLPFSRCVLLSGFFFFFFLLSCVTDSFFGFIYLLLLLIFFFGGVWCLFGLRESLVLEKFPKRVCRWILCLNKVFFFFLNMEARVW